MRINPESSGVRLFFAGNFIPAMYTPAWFELHDLLPKGTAGRVELQMPVPYQLEFSLDRFSFKATQESLEFNTVHEPYIRICDISRKLFTEPLNRPLVTAVWIIRDVHFCARSPAERVRIGRHLAPLRPWGRMGESLKLGGENKRMPSLSMVGDCPDGRHPEDAITVTVQPSAYTSNQQTGIYVGVYDGYTIPKDDPDAWKRFLESFDQWFEPSIIRSNDIVDHIMSLANDIAIVEQLIRSAAVLGGYEAAPPGPTCEFGTPSPKAPDFHGSQHRVFKDSMDSDCGGDERCDPSPKKSMRGRVLGNRTTESTTIFRQYPADPGREDAPWHLHMFDAVFQQSWRVGDGDLNELFLMSAYSSYVNRKEIEDFLARKPHVAKVLNDLASYLAENYDVGEIALEHTASDYYEYDALRVTPKFHARDLKEGIKLRKEVLYDFFNAKDPSLIEDIIFSS